MLTHSPQNEKKDIGNIRGVVRIPISFHPVESRGFYAGKKQGMKATPRPLENTGRRMFHR